MLFPLTFFIWAKTLSLSDLIISTQSSPWITQGILLLDPVYEMMFVQYCPNIWYDVSWTSTMFITTYSCQQRADWHHGKQLLNTLQFPVCDLEVTSCHALLPPRLLNHLPCWYVKWRTSAISAPRHWLPPATPLAHSIARPTASDPQGALLQARAQEEATNTIAH